MPVLLSKSVIFESPVTEGEDWMVAFKWFSVCDSFPDEGKAITFTSWNSSVGCSSGWLISRGPCTVSLEEARYLIASSGLIHGPPDWLHPGELNIPISISNSVAVFKARCSISHHSSLNIFTSP